MALLDDMALDVAGLFGTGELGVTVKYWPVNGTAADITVIIEQGADLSSAPGGMADVAVAHVQKTSVAAPAIYDRIIYGQIEYSVRSVASGNGPVWLLTLEETRRLSSGSG